MGLFGPSRVLLKVANSCCLQQPGIDCVVKMYRVGDDLPSLNQVVEFVGILQPHSLASEEMAQPMSGMILHDNAKPAPKRMPSLLKQVLGRSRAALCSAVAPRELGGRSGAHVGQILRQISPRSLWNAEMRCDVGLVTSIVQPGMGLAGLLHGSNSMNCPANFGEEKHS